MKTKSLTMWILSGKEGLYQVILKKIDLPIVPRDTCQDRLRKTQLGKYFNLHESFICAGGEIGKDACKVPWTSYSLHRLNMCSDNCARSLHGAIFILGWRRKSSRVSKWKRSYPVPASGHRIMGNRMRQRWYPRCLCKCCPCTRLDWRTDGVQHSGQHRLHTLNYKI